MAQPLKGKKALTVCILKLLERHSSCEAPLTRKRLIELLKLEYGMEAGRNAVSDSISLLREIGYDISSGSDNGKGVYLRTLGDEFDDMELRVLMDSVLTSRYIPEANAKQLIARLAKLSGGRLKSVPHVELVKEWGHQRNREFFWNLDALSEAVGKRTQVTFSYNRAGADGELHPLRAVPDTVDPYAIICASGQYYLIASYTGYDDLRHYRVDRMTALRQLDAPARDIRRIPGYRNGLNVAEYVKQHNLMYGGRAERIVLRVDGAHAGVILDSFGSAAEMKQRRDGSITATVFTSAEGMRFWALQYAGVAEVLQPESLRAQLREDIRALCAKYGA